MATTEVSSSQRCVRERTASGNHSVAQWQRRTSNGDLTVLGSKAVSIFERAVGGDDRAFSTCSRIRERSTGPCEESGDDLPLDRLRGGSRGGEGGGDSCGGDLARDDWSDGSDSVRSGGGTHSRCAMVFSSFVSSRARDGSTPASFMAASSSTIALVRGVKDCRAIAARTVGVEAPRMGEATGRGVACSAPPSVAGSDAAKDENDGWLTTLWATAGASITGGSSAAAAAWPTRVLARYTAACSGLIGCVLEAGRRAPPPFTGCAEYENTREAPGA